MTSDPPRALQPELEPPARRVELWLLRHAEVHADWQGKAYGDLDVPLSEEGERRTDELARDFGALALDVVLSSPLTRALRLGRALAERAGAPLAVEPGLAEIHRGRWQGRAIADLHAEDAAAVARFYADPLGFREHGGECDADVARRALPVVQAGVARTVAAATRGGAGRLAVAGHYNVLRVLVSAALGIPPARSFALRIEPGRAVLLGGAPEGWRLLHANVAGPGSLASLAP